VGQSKKIVSNALSSLPNFGLHNKFLIFIFIIIVMSRFLLCKFLHSFKPTTYVNIDNILLVMFFLGKLSSKIKDFINTAYKLCQKVRQLSAIFVQLDHNNSALLQSD